MVVDPTTLLPVVSGALSKNPSENREALVDVVVSYGTSEGRKKTPARWRIRDGGIEEIYCYQDKIAKGSREILHKVAYVTVLSNPWQTALICSAESFTSFRPKRNAPRDHEANRNWLRDIPRECENRCDGTDLAKRTKTSKNGSNGSNGSHREFTKILSIIRKNSNSHHQADHGDQSCFHFPRLGHAKKYIQRINKFLNSRERRSLRYKWLSTQHIYRSIVRGLRPFANAAGVDVAKMNDLPFFKKDPQRGPGFTEKVVVMSLINATCS
ncbi:hypothetical protein ALC57_06600 [Trachymyrmex cornetzi]|uniref:Uncharacterized protein n=1 Tax=Trachymyrmex cornetzi TaxID=471704 RepID=A0A151J891_9HYME|nr:hypothetical protein ALC57_06600 [Trachymyrmex cornetzi]